MVLRLGDLVCSKGGRTARRVATRSIGTETFDIIVSDEGIHELCRERAGSKTVMTTHGGERDMSLRSWYERDPDRSHSCYSLESSRRFARCGEWARLI